MKRKIFGVGLTSLVGSRVAELLADTYDFTNLSRATGFDITDPSTMAALADDTEHDTVMIFTAKTDVDGSEKERELGEESETYKLNVQGIENIIKAAKKSGKKLIYISTDFVFNGINPPEEGYTEEDTPNPLNWYGETKYMAEQLVQNSGLPYLIVRPSYPFRKEFDKKKDFVRGMVARLQSGEPSSGVVDQIFTPTFIDDIAYAIDVLIKDDETGIFHVAGSEWLSSYDIAHMIAQKFGLDESLIKTVTADEFLAGRAPRPRSAKMSNKKISSKGVKMHKFSEALEKIK